MSSVVVVGTQWGDEGKGKITDFLSENAEVIARYQGGDNAGHTIQFNGVTYKLHLIPSGIFSPEKISVIGNGVVLNPKSLITELAYLHERNVTTDNLRISDRAHVILPYHIRLDQLQEEAKGDNKIGTTNKGIGPCYIDKIARNGIRIGDLLDPERFRDKLTWNVKEKNDMLTRYGKGTFDLEELYEKFMKLAEKIKFRIIDAVVEINEGIEEGKVVLFEGAQALMLDIDYGTYPYVTSSSPTSGGVTVGTGVAPTKISRVLGVMKAYTTRVGEGPFPTELENEDGETLRKVGHEFGATTGRPRRCGWLDLVIGKYAVLIDGLTDIVLTKLDVLTGFEKIKVAVGYEIDGKVCYSYPGNLRKSKDLKIIYDELDGWKEDITQIKNYEDLPENCKKYIEYIENKLKCRVSMISVGPERTQNIYRYDLGEFVK